MSTPIAGPSRPTSPLFFPRPFRIDDYQPPPGSTSSRSSTPILPPVRARSTSTFSLRQEKKHNERLEKKRFESVQRLQSAWERLLEKYGDIRIEDDDEIDLITGRVVRNRGRLEKLVQRDFGEVSDDEEIEDDIEEDQSIDGDLDELGHWDERSGLDTQHPEDETPPQRPAWTYEDSIDLRAFMSAERERRRLAKERGENSEDEDEEPRDAGNSDDGTLSSDDQMSPRSRGTTIVNDLSSLFGDEEDFMGDDSEDELLAQTSDAEEATRVELVETPSEDEDDDEPIFIASRTEGRQQLGGSDDDRQTDSSRQSSRRRIEVVIPVRAPRSSSRNAPISSSKQRSATKPLLTRITSSPHLADLFDSPPRAPIRFARRSVSPELRGLFTPPPEASSLPPLTSASFIPRPLPFTVSVFQSDRRPGTATLAKATKSRKGKERAIEQDPSERLRSEPKRCLSCQKAGGVRADRAVRCRGRQADVICPYERNDMIDPSLGGEEVEEVDSPQAGPSRPLPRYKTPVRTVVTSVEDMEELSRKSSRAPRQCKACREAGGLRQQRAIECKGRRSGDLCPFDGEGYKRDHPQERFNPIDEDVDEDHRPLRMPVPSNTVPPKHEKWRYYTALTYPSPAAKTPRACKYCKGAGGERARNAIWCVGRVWAKRCTFFLDEERGYIDERLHEEGPPPQDDLPVPHAGPQTPSVHREERDISPVVVRTGSSSKRKRIMSDELDEPDSVASSKISLATLHEALQLPPSSPPPFEQAQQDVFDNDWMGMEDVESVLQPSGDMQKTEINRERSATPPPLPLTTSPRGGKTTLDDEHPDIQLYPQPSERYRSTSTLSPPPFSPPTPEPQPYRSFASRMSASLAPEAAIQVHRHEPLFLPASSNPPSSPGVRPIIPLRASTIAIFQPTPPPSSSGARSASLSSDHVPLSYPRRGILRQPSDAPSSAPRSAKRTRFSLAPRSPPHEISSDPMLPFNFDMDDDEVSDKDDDDELLLGPSSSPFSRHSSPSAVRGQSQFSREMSLRAQDIGVDLPEHTGRLSSRMLAELGPVLSASMDRDRAHTTLGSSVARLTLGNTDKDDDGRNEGRNTAVPAYTLPTPPRSFGSTTSSGSRLTPQPTNPVIAALMLPPPVPSKHKESAEVRPPTPTSGEEERDDETPEAEEEEEEAEDDQHENAEEVGQEEEVVVEPRDIVFKTITPLHLLHKSRSRSRSLSLLPKRMTRDGSFGSPSPPVRLPSTTPRKRSRLERSLARIARELTVNEGELEWGMDEEVGEEFGRLWREGSVVKFLD